MDDELRKAAEILNNDGVVVLPTETVYGIGANALSEKAVNKIFAVKTRAKNNPLIVHLKDKSEIEKYAIISNPIEQKLIDTFMPGPFTIILKKKEIISDILTANQDTVGIRMPDNIIAHDLPCFVLKEVLRAVGEECAL